MIAAIIGSRRGLPWATVLDEIRKLLDRGTIGAVVTGGALGADRMAESAALARGLPVRVIRPEWRKYGQSAGMRRNADIIAQAAEVFAFWDGQSGGTAGAINIARRMRKPVHVWQDGRWTS